MKRVAFFPSISLDRRRKTPIYRQLYDWFRAAIIDGVIRPGQVVPSSRGLAAALNVSRIPVLNAYAQLHTEGYLETFLGAGTCVARSIASEVLPGAPPRKATIRQRAPRRLSRSGLALSDAALPRGLENLGAFRVSLPALDHFPIRLWSALVARHSRTKSRALMSYGRPMGFLPLREAIAEYLVAVRSVRCDPSQILVTAGSQQGLQICAQALLNPGEPVCLEEPGYPGARHAFASAGAELIPIPVDEEGISVTEILRRGNTARLAYVTPSHQYPLGITMSAGRRLLLLSWARHADAWIIEDDYDSEYRFDGHPIASLQGMDTDARVIYVGTFSKVLFPALRLGYMVVPKDLVPAFSAVKDAADIFSSTLYQAVLTDFIREGHFASHLRRMRILYSHRRKVLVNAIHAEMGDLLQIVGAAAGMHLAALLATGNDDVTMSRNAGNRGISVMPLSRCCVAPIKRNGLILGYGGASAPQIRDGVRKLSMSWQES